MTGKRYLPEHSGTDKRLPLDGHEVDDWKKAHGVDWRTLAARKAAK